MALQDHLPLEARLARAVSAVSAASEPWPALSFLANVQQAPQNPPTGPSSHTPELADAAISECEALSIAVKTAAIISSNEDIDEISTRTLRYLLAPYLSAQALQSWQGSQSIRLEKLQKCSEELQTFFSSMDRLGLLTLADRDRVVDGTPDAILTPSDKRDQKIERYKLEKAAEKRLQFLMERLQTRITGEDDEEGERDANITLLQSAVRRAIDLHDGLATELDLLRYAENLRSKGVDPREHAARARPRGPPPGMRGMPSSFHIVSQREQERDAVFRPSHSLPTYTVEEWGEIEAQNMAKKQSEKHEAEITAKRRKEEEDSDGDEAVDRETMEARRWDDWKDEHNKGSGNTLR